MNKDSSNSFIVGRLKSFYYAFRGLVLLIKTEASIQVQLVVSLLLVFLGFYFDISSNEWMFQTLATGLLLGCEGMNTAIEKTADFVQPNKDSKIEFIKDVAAGAVAIVALSVVVIIMIIYIPKVL